MLKGPQRPLVDLTFEIPAVCADIVEAGRADLGLVPVTEIARQSLEIVPGVGISCRGPVRSILLISRVPPGQIQRLSVDSSSRTSTQLARIILRERYGATPFLLRRPPNLETMLEDADAALLIGDSALQLREPQAPYETLDLGEEWFSLTGLPMVFAASARHLTSLTRQSSVESCSDPTNSVWLTWTRLSTANSSSARHRPIGSPLCGWFHSIPLRARRAPGS